MEESIEYYTFTNYKRENQKETKRLQHAFVYFRLLYQLCQENPEFPSMCFLYSET